MTLSHRETEKPSCKLSQNQTSCVNFILNSLDWHTLL